MGPHFQWHVAVKSLAQKIMAAAMATRMNPAVTKNRACRRFAERIDAGYCAPVLLAVGSINPSLYR
jgi:hypothetical protein